MGLFELVFVATMFFSKPVASEVVDGLTTVHKNASYWLLFSSNIGAVIMPWMVYFQQSAVVARRLSTQKEVAQERTQSILGACMAQFIMVSVIMVLANTTGESDLKSIV